jgi:hypothetical protein
VLNLIKEHWEKGSTLVAVGFQSALAFQKQLADLSLTTRFFICGLAGVLAAFSVAEMLRKSKPTPPAGFGQQHRDAPKPPSWYVIRVLCIAAISLLSVLLLRQVATFHNVRLLEKRSSTDAFVGTIEIQPAHRPASLTVNLSTSQVQPVTIADIAPASWNREDPVKWGVQNQSPFGLTLLLENFKSPQVFGVWYKLSVAGASVDIQVGADPPEVQIIRVGDLIKYNRNIWIFGGILCTAALCYWASRSSWFRAAL